MREMAKYPQEFEQLLVHTGQHYGNGTLLPQHVEGVLFEDLELPQPDIYLRDGHAAERIVAVLSA